MLKVYATLVGVKHCSSGSLTKKEKKLIDLSVLCSKTTVDHVLLSPKVRLPSSYIALTRDVLLRCPVYPPMPGHQKYFQTLSSGGRHRSLSAYDVE